MGVKLHLSSPVLQQDLGDQVLQTGVERLGEESEDLLGGAEVVEEDVMRQTVERLNQLEGKHTDI